MCEPVTAIAAATVVLAGVQAYNTNQQGKANAKALEQQATIDQMAKADVMAQGDRETERMLWRTRQALGQQRAAIGAAGVDPTLGTPSELLGETALFGEIEMQDARLNAARQAWGYDVSAANNLTAAGNERVRARNEAGVTLLGGLINAGSMAGGSGAANAGRYQKPAIGPVTKQRIPIPSYR